MRRQRWRKSLKSFIDPGKDEQLRGIKSEIDGKVQKIFSFLKEKDGDDRNEALANLIEDFHKQYESLYDRYGHLTGELRNKFHGKRGKDSASSSSDSSDSDDSPTESGKTNGEVEIKIEENPSVSISEREELEKKLAAAVDEKEALHQEYQTALKSKNGDVSLLRDENAQLQFRNSEMEKVLMVKENEFSDLQKKFGDRESELSERIMTLTADVNNLREQLGYTSDQKSESDRIVEKQRGEMSEILVQIENMKEELSRAENRNTELGNKTIEQEREMQEQRDEFMKLSEEHKQLEVRFRDCQESLVLSEKKIEEISDQFRESMTAKNQDIDQLEETIDELKSDLEMREDEISTLVENMRATEVKQRLSGQKLRITEQVLSEKEESHQKRVEKLQEEQRLLEQRIASLAGIVSIYEEAQVNLVADISEKMNETLMGIDTFSVKFEEDYGHLESRIYEIGNELKVVVNWITGNNAEKDELKKEIVSLLQQLKDEKGKELVMREKIEEMEMRLQNNEDERKSLTDTVRQQEEKAKELEAMIELKEEKVGELERKMREKDSGILSLSEEKREAIRQLCIWIDFHHDRYEDLKDMIVKRRGGRGQIAA
ncbi:hypothetical protein C2S52_008342 [Perilla frutescens var. hirtella]|nr:hypothetical protein C2S51_017927 [Perilla frutescens var. frutescens]KAH6783383.1 hypothetical protein C2S52_008342 [Perilla frutescens var. hirtella]